MVHFALDAPLQSAGKVTLASGLRLHYAHQGPARGPAIILLHGYSDSSFSFSRVMPLLPSDLRVVAPDFRGHGDSARPAAGYRISDLAADVIAMMEALEIPAAVVVGHSMGSFVAQAVAEHAPHRVLKLVLLGSAEMADNAGIRELREEVDAMTDPIDPGFVHAFQHSTIATEVPEPFMDSAIAISRRMPAHIWKQVLQGLMEFRPKFPRPSVKTLVLGGTRDAVFSVDEQTALARAFPNAELRLIDGIGHTLHWEDPEQFATVLLDFLK
jgi:pimeloyl-ACP methyl ester carboxylesterase